MFAGFILYLGNVYQGEGLSLLFQIPIASVLTPAALGVVLLIGGPLLNESTWMRWSRLGWYTGLLPVLGLFLIYLSFHPSIALREYDSELQIDVYFSHPWVWCAGWGTTMFGLAYCPKIGFGLGDERRWY